MTSATTNVSDLRGRKKIRLRRRPNLNIESRLEGGRKVYLVKDPVGLRYFHLDEAQHFALGMMDGRKTLHEIHSAYEQQFKPHRLPQEELEAFASQLLQNGLAEIVGAPSGKALFERRQQQLEQKRWASLLNVFYLKIPLGAPTKLLNALLPLGRLIFHPVFAFLALVAAVFAGGVVFTHWNEFLGRLPTYQDVFNWRGLLCLWLAVGIVKILHELGHGLCAKVVGGDVHEFGAVLLFFFPTLYCNVTDCWTLKSKWKRIAVSAAGIYVELLIATCAALAWWYSDADSFAGQFSFALILVCGVHTLLFNANPLMRFDGYFVLSDLVEIPNLAQAASSHVKTSIKQWFGMPVGDVPPGPRLFLIAYGLGAFADRILVMFGVAYVFFWFMKEQRLAWLASSCIVAGLFLVLAMPVWRLYQTIKRMGRFPEMKRSRLWLTVTVLFGLIFVAVLVPFPASVRGTALLQVRPDDRERVVVPAPGGFLDQVFVRDGQTVRQGDVLAVLRNPDLDRELRMNQAEQALRREQQQNLALKLASLDLVGSQSESYSEIEHEIDALIRRQESLQRQKASLTLRAPRDGAVMSLPDWEVKGKWLKNGVNVCEIGNPRSLRAVVLVESADRRLFVEGASADLLAHGTGSVWDGKVVAVAQVSAEDVPVQLSNRVGGDVVTEHDSVAKTERPIDQRYLVEVQLQNVDQRLQPGALGQIRIGAGSRTIWQRAERWLRASFPWGI